MRRFWGGAILPPLALFLSGCGVTDAQIGARVVAANKGVDSARNDSLLLNILRAADSQPLTFVAISKISGSQNTDLKLGLPTLTIGRGKTAEQKQIIFGSNSWENSANSSFDAAPLETGGFFSAMSSSVDLETMEAFIRQGYSRELVFSALIGSVRVEGGGIGPAEYRNDPLLTRRGCEQVVSGYGDLVGGVGGAHDYRPGANEGCEFRHFEFLLQVALKWGLDIEAVDAPKSADPKQPDVTVAVTGGQSTTRVAASVPAAGADTNKGGGSKHYRFCFDRALAQKNQLTNLLQPEVKPYLCGASAKDRGDSGEALTVRFGSSEPAYSFDIRPRSGLALFRYLGHSFRAGADGPRLYWRDSIPGSGDDDGEGPALLMNISSAPRSAYDSCFAKVAYFGKTYCVPYANATATKQVFGLAAELVALSTSALALPTTLDVRLQ